MSPATTASRGWLTTADVSDIAKRNQDEVQRAISRGELPAWRPTERGNWRIDPKDVERWLKRYSNQPATPAPTGEAPPRTTAARSKRRRRAA